MSERKYSIVTGYWNGGDKDSDAVKSKLEFYDIWWANTLKFTKPKDIFTINSDGQNIPKNKFGQWTDLSFNLGHVHDLDKNAYPHKKFGGWSMSFIIGATICYANDCDMIFKEQDCLAFGDWVEALYKDLEQQGVKMLVGRPEDGAGQGCAQSLMLVKHEFLLDFLTVYLAFPYNDAGPNFVRPEAKFRYIKDKLPNNPIGYMKMGYDRARPVSYNEETYYVQQLKDFEIDALKKAGKI